MQAGIDVTLICDNMAALVMRQGKVGLVIVGADRIAANGDTANKIGTYGVAILAAAHHIPFFVAAPSTHLRPRPCADGTRIPIEERNADEITTASANRTAPDRRQDLQPRLRRDARRPHRRHHHRARHHRTRGRGRVRRVSADT